MLKLMKITLVQMDAQTQGMHEHDQDFDAEITQNTVGEEGLKTAGYRVTTAGSRLMLLLKLMLISQIED
ncbi:hypothetical protein Tco_1376848 [Tanacetum coccineum]